MTKFWRSHDVIWLLSWRDFGLITEFECFSLLFFSFFSFSLSLSLSPSLYVCQSVYILPVSWRNFAGLMTEFGCSHGGISVSWRNLVVFLSFFLFLSLALSLSISLSLSFSLSLFQCKDVHAFLMGDLPEPQNRTLESSFCWLFLFSGLLESSFFFLSLLWLFPPLLPHLSILSEVWFLNFLRQ